MCPQKRIDRNRLVDFCKCVENRNSRRAGGLSKPFFSYAIDVRGHVVVVVVSRMRLRDHGVQHGISQYSISHLAFF